MSSRRSSDYVQERLSQNWWRNCTDRSAEKNPVNEDNLLCSHNSDRKTELSNKQWWTELSQDESIPLTRKSVKRTSEISINISANEDNTVAAGNTRLLAKRKSKKNKNRFLQSVSNKDDWKQTAKSAIQTENVTDTEIEQTNKSNDSVNEHGNEVQKKPNLFNRRLRSESRFSKAFDVQVRSAEVIEEDSTENIKLVLNKNSRKCQYPYEKSNQDEDLGTPLRDYNLRRKKYLFKHIKKDMLFSEAFQSEKPKQSLEAEETNQLRKQSNSASKKRNSDMNEKHLYTYGDVSEKVLNNYELPNPKRLFKGKTVNERQFSDAFKEFLGQHRKSELTMDERLSQDHTSKPENQIKSHLLNVTEIQEKSKGVSVIDRTWNDLQGTKQLFKSSNQNNRQFSEAFNYEEIASKENINLQKGKRSTSNANEAPRRRGEHVSKHLHNLQKQSENAVLGNKQDNSVGKSENELPIQKVQTRHSEPFNNEFGNENNLEDTPGKSSLPQVKETAPQISQRISTQLSNSFDHKQGTLPIDSLRDTEKSNSTLPEKQRLFKAGAQNKRLFSEAFHNENLRNTESEHSGRIEKGSSLSSQRKSKRISNQIRNSFEKKHTDNVILENKQNTFNISVEEDATQLIQKKKLFRSVIRNKRQFSEPFLTENLLNEKDKLYKGAEKISSVSHIYPTSHQNPEPSMTRLQDSQNKEHENNFSTESKKEMIDVSEKRCLSTRRDQSHQRKSERINKRLQNWIESQKEDNMIKDAACTSSLASENINPPRKSISQGNNDTDITGFSSISSIEQSDKEDQRRVLFHPAKSRSDGNTLEKTSRLRVLQSMQKSNPTKIKTNVNDNDSLCSTVNSEVFERSLPSHKNNIGEKNVSENKLITNRNGERNTSKDKYKPNLQDQGHKENFLHERNSVNAKIRAVSKQNRTSNLQENENIPSDNDEHSPQIYNNTSKQLMTKKQFRTNEEGTFIQTEASKEIEVQEVNEQQSQILKSKNKKSNIHKSFSEAYNPESVNNVPTQNLMISTRTSNIKRSDNFSNLRDFAPHMINSNIVDNIKNASNKILDNDADLCRKHTVPSKEEYKKLYMKDSKTTKEMHEQNPFFGMQKYLKKKSLRGIVKKPQGQMKPLTTYFPVVPKTVDHFPIFEKSSVTKKVQKIEKTKSIHRAMIIEGHVYRPQKLYKKQHWMSTALYKHLQKTMETKFEEKAVLESENVMKLLGEAVLTIMKSSKYQPSVIKKLAKELAQRNIVKTMYEFYNFCEDYLPHMFCDKVIPRVQIFKNETTVPFDPSALFKNIVY